MFDSLARLERMQRQLDRWLPEQAGQDPEAHSQTDLAQLPLLELIPALRPANEAPHHLGPLVAELEQAIAPHQGQRFYWFSVPPRHWKTTTLINAAIKHLLAWPDEGVAYVSHTQTFANKQSRAMRKLARQAGLELSREANRQDEWELASANGGLVARGIGGELTGRGCRLILLDDLIKNREIANSQTEREKIWESLQEDILTRLSPDGTAILVHTRWHPDDPIGRAKKLDDWRGKNIPALSGPQDDQALLPEHWPLEALDKIRKANAYKFAALYQGAPRPRGNAVFEEPAKFEWPDEKPRSRYNVAFGVDLAFSEKAQKRADFSVVLKMLRVDSKDRDPEKALYYVVDVERAQVQAPEFCLVLKTVHDREPGPMLWYFAGGEKGSGQFIQQKVDQFAMVPATADKFIRATPVAELWNQGRILVPGGEDRPDWVDDFVDEVTSFTGVKDAHDDQVDALAAAFDLLHDDDGEAVIF